MTDGKSTNQQLEEAIKLAEAAAIRVEEVYFKGKKLHGTLKILNTDSGKLLQSLINAKCKFKAAMIAIGTVTHGTVRDLNIITFNVVRV